MVAHDRRDFRHTKIVCTIGPASDTSHTLERLASAGMNVARINMSHGSHKSALMIVQRIQSLNREINHPVSDSSPHPVTAGAGGQAPQRPGTTPGGRGRGGQDRGRGRGRGNGRERGNRSSSGGADRGPRRNSGNDFQTGDFERFAGEIPTQGPESEQAAGVRAWYERLLQLSKLQLEIRTEENETQVIVRLFGADARLLTEQHGELLDAIQVLGNKALVGRNLEKEIELNCEAFKERRAEQLAETAREVAERVRAGGREQLLPSMTPIERRIVHLALQEDADVTTESRGDGFYKRVAIVARQKQAD